MATFTASIVNTINVFGAGPTSKWGSMVWGVNVWGEGDLLYRSVFKVIEDVGSFTNALTFQTKKIFTNSLSADSDIISMTRSIGIYKYVFTKPTTDGDNQVITSFSTYTGNSASYTTYTTSTVTWSTV